jgi:methionyl-tRNA formyltransferase
VYTPATLKDIETQQLFREHKADAAIVAAYGLLLPRAILEGTRMGCLNVHPSLLPRWRGAAPIQRTIMAGDKQTGVVIMQMNAGLDTGDMLMIEHYDIAPGTNAGTLLSALAELAAPMMLNVLKGLQNDTITPIKQPVEGVTYAKKITKEECRIHWNEPAAAIYNNILGLSPQPGAYFLYKNEAIKVLDAECITTSAGKPAGTVIGDLLEVQCVDGALRLTRLQRPGKNPMTAAEMLMGYAIPQGTQLE